MPITKIALSAGFTSIRQFNHAVRGICGQSPTELRRARGEFTAPAQGGLAIRLAYRPPFDWPALMSFLAPRTTPGVETVQDGAYRRTICIGGSAGTIEVRPSSTESALEVRIELPGYQYLMKVVERVRRMFDLGADPLRIADDLSCDRRLKPLIDRRPGLRVPGAWDGFELAVHAILYQKMTLHDATLSVGRLVRSFGKPLQSSVPGLTHLFPKPGDLADADLSQAGIHGASVTALVALARAVCSGELTFAASMTLREAISRLCGIPGIGENTAHYIAMRALGEPDAFPFDHPMPTAEGWRPWRAYAAMHLWAAEGVLAD